MSEEEMKDSFTVGTPATGGAIKLYFDFSKESKEDIDKKITFAVQMSENAKAFKARLGGK